MAVQMDFDNVVGYWSGMLNEAWRAVDEGVATPEDVDKAMKLGLGHPVGPFQMQDLVGLDNALSVSGIRNEA
jgi:3-hydroxyacyl-CoA dehydrogenase